MQTVAVADARTRCFHRLVCEVGIARGQTRTQIPQCERYGNVTRARELEYRSYRGNFPIRNVVPAVPEVGLQRIGFPVSPAAPETCCATASNRSSSGAGSTYASPVLADASTIAARDRASVIVQAPPIVCQTRAPRLC